MRYLNLLFLVALLPLSQLQAAEELLVYSGRSDKFVKPVMTAFTRETGIKVVLHAGSSTALLNKLQLEGERTSADIYISNDAGNLQKGSDMKLFRALPKSIIGISHPIIDLYKMTGWACRHGPGCWSSIAMTRLARA